MIKIQGHYHKGFRVRRNIKNLSQVDIILINYGQRIRWYNKVGFEPVTVGCETWFKPRSSAADFRIRLICKQKLFKLIRTLASINSSHSLQFKVVLMHFWIQSVTLTSLRFESTKPLFKGLFTKSVATEPWATHLEQLVVLEHHLCSCMAILIS